VHAALVVASILVACGPAWAQGQPAPAPLVQFEVRNDAIASPLTSQPGDVQRGRAVVVNRQLGNCLACHAISALNNEPYHGNTAPSLDGVAARMNEGELRLRIVDGSRVNENTMMPPFYRTANLNRVLPQFQGRTILTAQQIEDVVAFLMTLRTTPAR
jgi:L-cysteine S-thiosulfotransferase